MDGLELSVECASDKEESSSENEDEEDAKPRPKTVIVKAEPNESELECSLSEEEKNDLLETTLDISENKSEKNKTKKRDGQTSFNEIKNSESKNNQNNNFDEDYSSRIKKKIKKSLEMRRSTKRVVESRRGENTKSSHKKSTQYSLNNKNCNTMSAEKVDKNVKNKIKEAFSEKESSVDKSENNIDSEEEGKPTKSKRTRRSNRPNEIVSNIVFA